MDITIHEEFYGQKSLNQEASPHVEPQKMIVHRQTITNIMAYSKALSVSCFDSLGTQEIILN